MTELLFHPRDGLRQRAEIRAEDATGDLMARRVAGKVDSVVADTGAVVAHARLTRGTPLDELHAIEEAVDRHLAEAAWLAAEMQKVEDEIQHLRSLYRRAIWIGAGLLAVLILVLLVVVLLRR